MVDKRVLSGDRDDIRAEILMDLLETETRQTIPERARKLNRHGVQKELDRPKVDKQWCKEQQQQYGQ